jgi:hypothetical protein
MNCFPIWRRVGRREGEKKLKGKEKKKLKTTNNKQ